MAIDYVCETCGSLDVSRDAWAHWDGAAQQWVLGTMFDFAQCHRCEGRTRLVERERPSASD